MTGSVGPTRKERGIPPSVSADQEEVFNYCKAEGIECEFLITGEFQEDCETQPNIRMANGTAEEYFKRCGYTSIALLVG